MKYEQRYIDKNMSKEKFEGEITKLRSNLEEEVKKFSNLKENHEYLEH